MKMAQKKTLQEIYWHVAFEALNLFQIRAPYVNILSAKFGFK